MSTLREAGPEKSGTPVPVARIRTALITLALAFGLVQLDATVVTVALPAVRADLGGGLALGQWLVDAYVIPFAAAMLAAGALGDRWGHRQTCSLGCLVFAASSTAAALAGSWDVLIAARIVQGLGAAMLLPASLAMIGTLFPDRVDRARALGIWGGIATTGFALGPVVGGLLATHAGWPVVFWINLPLGVLLAVAVRLSCPAGQRNPRPIDRLGTILASLTLAAVAGAVIGAGQGRLLVAGLLVLSAGILAVAFRSVERRASQPLIPPSMVRPGPFRAALATGFVFNFVLYGLLFSVTVVMTAAFGASVLQAGLAALPMAVVVSIGATSSGFLSARMGPRRPMVAGFAAAAIGSLLLVLAWNLRSVVLMVIATAVVGLISLAMPAMTSVALGAVAPEQAGTGAGALNSARQMGGAIGVALLGAMLNAGQGGWGLTAAAAVAAAGCMVAVRTSIRATDQRERVEDRRWVSS
ncbi:MAG: MFS transporter [Nakamurella sp.]